MGLNIISLASYLPPHIVTNQDLEQLLETDNDWIVQRVGVKQRHIATDETTGQMGAKAARKALDEAGLKGDEIDLILCATVSSDDASPCTAAMVQHHLGLSCPAMDIAGACSGFGFLMQTGLAFLQLSGYDKILLVTSEKMSRLVDWTDRSTAVIFGDGAAALLVEASDKLADFHLANWGGDDVIKVPNHPGNSPWYQGPKHHPYIYMNGQETFKFAVQTMAKDVKQVLARNSYTVEDVAMIVAHQANIRILQAAARRLGVGEDKVFQNIERYGNTSASSIPIALDECIRSGKISRGDLVVFTSFGGGLSSAAGIIRY
ncbi:MAG TPA: ketoacyl-ACP synthase III [Tissierellia bacterium]|nr:ketoacyl-ACP synthase III [Tissierellia bacterium]